MRIAFWHFHTFRMNRGIETLVVSLANALSGQGHDVSIVTVDGGCRPLVEPRPGVQVFRYPEFRYWSAAAVVPYYLNHFSHNRYDCVITFFSDFGEGTTLRLLDRFHRMPLALYLCYPLSSVPHRLRAFQKYGWSQRLDFAFADARWIADEASSLFGRPFGVVPVGTDTSRFSPCQETRRSMRAQFGYGEEEVVLLNVSALEKEKGTWRVLHALKRLRKDETRLRYFILGAGKYEPELQAYTREHGLADIVRFGGVTSELEAYYRMADLFVMLPDAEANSVASLEAMSSGLPLLVSSTGGFPESVPESAGILVHPDDQAAVDRALLTLAGSEDLRASLGRGGRDHVVARYDWNAIARSLTGMLQ